MAARNHDLICSYTAGNLWVDADPTRLEQIIMNLLTNAAKYTAAGGRIGLLGRLCDGEVRVIVRDNGIGIAPERLPDMFQLFAQGERSIARSEGGLGIGLTIVQKLVEMHGGRIDAHSDGPNHGSTFTVCLPAALRPGLPPNKNPHQSDGSTPRRVLIVDDNVDTAHGLGRLLARMGHQIVVAHDGYEALNRAREQPPEMIVLDIGLPGMDGFEVAQCLRREPSCAGAVIIAVTGYGQPEDRQRAIDAGFNHHLVKPVDIEELKTLLQSQPIR